MLITDPSDAHETNVTLLGVAVRAVLWLLILNFIVQLALKPTEIFRLSGVGDSKTIRQTWEQYKDDFREHATATMTADFLAGLAYTESSGNPYAQPPWIWRLTLTPWRVYAPASSAVGLMQMTDGNFAQARRFCIQNGKPASDACRLNGFYSRLSASDSLEMTSAFLQTHVDRLAPKKATLRQRQALASVIHLCGPEKGPALIRAKFEPNALGICGRQPVGSYVRRVMINRQEFARLLKTK